MQHDPAFLSGDAPREEIYSRDVQKPAPPAADTAEHYGGRTRQPEEDLPQLPATPAFSSPSLTQAATEAARSNRHERYSPFASPRPLPRRRTISAVAIGVVGISVFLAICFPLLMTTTAHLPPAARSEQGQPHLAPSATATGLPLAISSVTSFQTPGLSDPCALVPVPSLHQVIGPAAGTPTVLPVAHPPAGATQAVVCSWYGAQTVIFSYDHFGSVQQAVAAYAAQRQHVAGTTIAGIGDAAYRESSTGTLDVQRQAVVFTVLVTGGSIDTAAEQELARVVVAAL